MTIPRFSFKDPAVQRDPFPIYDALRQAGPVWLDKTTGFYTVLSHAEIRKAAADPTTFSSVTGQLLVRDAPYQERINAIYRAKGYEPLNVLVVADPPEHTFFRSFLDKVFTPSRVARMESYIADIADGVIDSFIDRGEVEFCAEMALKVPNFVLSDAIGLPREHYMHFKRWTDAILAENNQDNDEAQQVAATETICELHQYLTGKVAEYRAHPDDASILSAMVNSTVGGRQMTMAEIASVVVQMLPAGSSTTVSALTSAMYRLVTTPGLEKDLRGHPELTGNFVDEVLRLDAPVQGLYRRVTRDTRIAGTDIPEGAIVMLKFGAGNRDPEQFPDPHRLDIRRTNARMHLTFGHGKHLCVGNQVARAEIRIAIERLLARMHNLRLAGEVGWIAHFIDYGPNRLPIAFDRA